MISLTHINDYTIDTSNFNSLLNDPIVEEFENTIANYVGAKYACSIHSATMAIFLCLIELEKQTIEISTIIPPVVPNAILCAGHDLKYRDDTEWVGHSYILKDFGNYKIIDSAQQLDKGQFLSQANDEDLMIFSFYPTKPVGSIDGGMIVSNDKTKIDRLKVLSRYGMTPERNSWDRKIILPGWKMYMNSIQAHVGMQNFKKLENKARRFDEIREKYNNAFAGTQNSSRHLYRICVDERGAFLDKMKAAKIQCGIHYSAVHNIPCYARPGQPSLPKSESHAQHTVSLPYHEKLTDEQIEYVIKNVKEHIN
mgnify:CR=1 FL=1|tara:strand:- start:1398 stop:2327 length:930 start_codon:yes stop_codon:yes gene_type:complete